MEIIRCTIHDLETVTFIMNTPDIRDGFAEDGDGLGQYEFYLRNNDIYIAKIVHYDNPIGIFSAFPLWKVCYEIQAAVLAPYRGKYAVEASRMGIEWGWNNTEARKFVAFIAECNLKSYALARQAGMIREGKIKKAWLKNGRLYDKIVMGICKEERDGKRL
jgi:RimJ/RimL family protein N-acetyltransferase